MPTDADLPVVHNPAAKRFEISLDGRSGLVYLSAISSIARFTLGC
jgi:hypothetical protein